MKDVIGTFIYEAQKDHMLKVEAFLRLRIKPRPWWLPKRVHHWLLQQLIVLEESR